MVLSLTVYSYLLLKKARLAAKSFYLQKIKSFGLQIQAIEHPIFLFTIVSKIGSFTIFDTPYLHYLH